MKKRFMSVAALMFAMGCNLGGGTTVYYPAQTKKTTVIIEEHQHEEPVVIQETSVVTESYAYAVCDPYFELYDAPYYHEPEFCTDYGVGVGYCCTWEYIDNYGALCSSESCFWEDTCQWEHVIDECYYDEYYEYY